VGEIEPRNKRKGEREEIVCEIEPINKRNGEREGSVCVCEIERTRRERNRREINMTRKSGKRTDLKKIQQCIMRVHTRVHRKPTCNGRCPMNSETNHGCVIRARETWFTLRCRNSLGKQVLVRYSRICWSHITPIMLR
jgi:hypothetical protein